MKRTLYLFLLVMLLLTGCNDPKPMTDALARAEALMNEYPDSAWAVLNTLSPDEMGQNRTRAHYALLYTQAQDKTYRDETNDSLISVAVDYYRDTDDVRRKFLSYYYQGRVYTNAGASIEAMLSFLEAESLCEEVDDDYLHGLLYTQMGVIYKDYYDYSKSLEMFQKATVCYEQAGKDLHHLYALVDQANICKNIGENEDAFQLLQFVLEEGKRNNYRGLVKSSLGDLIMLCVKLGYWDEADVLLHELRQDYGLSTMSSSFMADVAEIYAIKKDWNLSHKVLQQAWQRVKNNNDSIVLYFAEARIHEMQYPQTETYYLMLKGVKEQNRLVRKRMEQPVLSLQNNLLKTELEYQQYRLRTERMHRWVIVWLVLIVSILVVYVGQKWLRKLYRKRIRERLQKLQTNHKQVLESLLKKVEEKDEKIHAIMVEFNHKLDLKDTNFRRVLVELENELASKDRLYNEYVQQTEVLRIKKEHYFTWLNRLFIERIAWVDEMLQIQNSDFGSDKLKEKALNVSVDTYIKKVTKSKRSYMDLEELVNISCQNVMVRLRSEVKLPDEDSYRQVCYHIAGYSVYGISVLMGETKNKIYKRRDRIRKKIEDLNPKSLDLFNVFLYK